MSETASIDRRVAVAIRLLAAIGGGYAVAAGLASLGALGLSAASLLSRSEAVVLASMLAFPIYLALLVWGFAERRLGRLCLMLAAAALASWGGAFTLVRLTAGA
jgi:hypothetical protein